MNSLPVLLRSLKARRAERGLSLTDVSRLSGLDRSFLSRLENGHHANPTVDTLQRYAEAVGFDLEWTVAAARTR